MRIGQEEAQKDVAQGQVNVRKKIMENYVIIFTARNSRCNFLPENGSSFDPKKRQPANGLF